ncbi:non-ribosomal peptide synthetase, partial [Paenibacillus tepidiphilus]|uniref:non-ribosomal peptide synthetase n=1 Tax=Paenibacillus tepidiphilus TaxID=2608683 RepID=UPI0013A58078
MKQLGRSESAVSLTHAQKRIWMMEQHYPGTPLNNITLYFIFKGEANLVWIEAAIHYNLSNHAGFGLRISRNQDGEPYQYYVPHPKTPFPLIDFSTSNHPNEALELWTQQQAKIPFQFENNPLYYIALFKVSDDECGYLIKVHHIIADGWSGQAWLQDTLAIYEKLAKGESHPVGRSSNFLDFADHEDHYLRSNRYIKDKQFWLQRYQDYESPTVMGTSKGITSDSAGTRKSFLLNKELSERIREKLDENRVSLNAWFVALMLAYLNRTTGQSDLVIGTPVSNRSGAKEKSVIGMFASTMPLRVQVNAVQSFDSFSREVQQQLMSCYFHQKYPYDNLVQELELRKKGIDQLFSVVVNNLGTRLVTNVEGLTVKANEVYNGHQFYPFQLMIKDWSLTGELELAFDYKADHSDGIVEQIFSTFVVMLQDILGESSPMIQDIRLLDEEGTRQLTLGFNDTAAEYPREATIHGLFEAQVEKTPDAVAVVYGDQQLTYAELNARANRLAWTLRRQGVEPDCIVAIMAERSLELMVGIYGILKAGGAYLPIDPAYPKERIQYMLGDSGASALLIDAGLDPCGFEGAVIELTSGRQEQSEANPPQELNSRHLAYVMYTSGTTGNPKGVMMDHRAVINRLQWMQNWYCLREEDVILQKTPITFDVSVSELFWWGMTGARVCMLSLRGEKDPAVLAETIERHGITVMHFVPSMLSVFLEQAGQMFSPEKLRSLRRVFASGEALKPQHVTGFYKLMEGSGATLHNLYGPTEAAEVSYYDCMPLFAETAVPIGKPLANTQLYIVGDDLQLKPVGIAGELYLAGDGLARGYFNRPDLTAEKFVDNPFEPGTKMYRTGDLARWLPDGNVEYLGRIDHQVKIRGYRIECGEIEAQLMAQGHIREAVVIAREDEQGQAYLCAYLVSDEAVPVPELRAQLAAQLPEYMIPSYFVELEKLPLTANGKVDRKVLPVPDREAYTEGYEAPRDALERQLAELFAEVLGVKEVGIGDSFFARGGHSLKAMTLVSRIHQRLAVELPLRELFARPTVKALAAYVRSTEESDYGRIEPAAVQASYPLSSAQRRLYVLHEVEPESTRYNMPGVMELTGQVDGSRLKQAIRSVIARHESLRTSFTWIGGEPRQQVHEEVALEWIYREADEGQARELARGFVQSFALDQAPLLRAGLLRLAEERHWLLWDMHHIVSDGVSLHLLVSDLMAAYAGEELTPLRIQYKDYAVWQQGTLGIEQMQEHEAYWLSAYAEEAPVLELPADRTRPAVPSSEGGQVHAQINADVAEGLKQLAAETGATLYMVLLAAYNVWLHKYTGQTDIVVGTPVSGRTHGDTEPMIGMFVNTLALRNAPSGDKRFIDFLREVKERTLAAFEHQDYPFEELVEKLNVRRDMSRNPLFDTMLVLQNMEQARFGLAGVDVRPVELDHRATKLDLTLNVAENDQGLQLLLEYSRALFNEDTAGRYLVHFVQLLSQIGEQPEARIGSYELVTPEEKVQLLHGFNDTAAAYPQEATIHGLFEEQAEKTPDAVVVVYGEQQLTYAELNARANQLAWTLRGQCVGPETIVAVLAERSLELMVGLYGILKAGGAYLPIDPALPAERIRYMLRDSGAAVLLTQPGQNACGFEGAVIELTPGGLAGGRAGGQAGEQVPSGGNTPLEPDSRRLAYVIYTSGTTGNPKGVMIEHRSVVNRLQWMQNRYPIGAGDVILQKTPITFDVSVWELFWWGMTGAKVSMLPPQGEKDPAVLAETIEHHGVTVMHFVPSMLSVFLEQAGQVFSPEKLGSLRRVFASGEALKPQHVTGFYKVLEGSGATLHNLYGPTEATVDVTYYDTASTFAEAAVPIGKPIANTQLYIVGDNRQPQPIGVPGELCIAGDGLARGYLNRPELTAEKFIDNPFGPGTKMYRTGDLARWLPDGNVEYLGRIDHQVKIRGYRIECGEIEARLMAYGHICEAVVMAREDEQGQAYLCAYLVNDEAVPVAELRVHLATQLPDYMIPSYFVELEKLPLTANGKVDRKALPAPDREAHTEGYEAPRDALERQLAELFAEVLGVKEVGIGDSFFARGGHSLKAMTLVSRIHQRLAVELPLRELFARPTVKALADYVRSIEESGYGRIEPAAMQASYPLSSAQRRMYVLHEVEPESTRYNMPGVMELTGQVDGNRLKQAIRSVIARHESLRTSFTWIDGEPRQRVHEDVVLEWVCREADEGQARDLARGFVRPFALEQAPLLRAVLLRLAAERYWLLWDMHHIVSDGVSMNLLMSDLMAAYAGEELTPLRIQYKDYAVWQQGTLGVEQMQVHEAYWLSAYAEEAPVLELPADRTRPAVPGSEGGQVHAQIRADMAEGLKQLAGETGATLYMVLLAAYNVWLHKYTGQTDIVVGTPVSGRTHTDT